MDTSGLIAVRSAIVSAAGRAGTPSDDITLVAVSKGRPHEDVLTIMHAGQSVFGENRQQGLTERIDSGLFDDVEWHFIGPLQRRKVPYVASHVTLLHSLDRLSLATRWAGSGMTPALIQFNLGGESQKSGFDPGDADRVMDEILEAGIVVRGVMAIPPLSNDPETTRPHFSMLRTIFDRYRERYDDIDHCSMGMTNDFEVAIEEGSTMVRVGRAIFEPTKR